MVNPGASNEIVATQIDLIDSTLMAAKLQSIDIVPFHNETITPRQQRKRRGGSNINYALYDKTGCPNLAPEVKSNSGEDAN